METSYLQDPSQCGNVLKGFEGFLSTSKSTALYGYMALFSNSLLYTSICGTPPQSLIHELSMVYLSGMLYRFSLTRILSHFLIIRYLSDIGIMLFSSSIPFGWIGIQK